MRVAYYPGSSAYPSWVKPVLVSIGALFVASSAFLIILIWKGQPQAVGQTGGMQASAAIPDRSAGGTLAMTQPSGPGAATAELGAAMTTPLAAAPTRASDSRAIVRLSHPHRRSHHRTHQKVARGSHRKHHRSSDPLLDALN